MVRADPNDNMNLETELKYIGIVHGKNTPVVSFILNLPIIMTSLDIPNIRLWALEQHADYLACQCTTNTTCRRLRWCHL